MAIFWIASYPVGFYAPSGQDLWVRPADPFLFLIDENGEIRGLQNSGPKQHQDLSLGIQLVVVVMILIRFVALRGYNRWFMEVAPEEPKKWWVRGGPTESGAKDIHQNSL
jgi:hypothetical protein